LALAIPTFEEPRKFNTYVDVRYFNTGIPSGIFETSKVIKPGLKELVAFNARKQQKMAKGDLSLNRPQFIIVHCSDSTWGTAREIRKWHLERGFNDIGYNYVILNGKLSTDFELPVLNGSIEVGRWWEIDGAHTIGYNDRSIGICAIAKDTWTSAQKLSLIQLCKTLIKQFDINPDNILGHCETDSGKKESKTCPNLDMNEIRKIIKEEL